MNHNAMRKCDCHKALHMYMCRTNDVWLHVLPETEVHTDDSQHANVFGGVFFIDFCFSLQRRRFYDFTANVAVNRSYKCLGNLRI